MITRSGIDEMINKTTLQGVFNSGKRKKKLYTASIRKGTTFFSENVVQQDGTEYREWDPTRSKVAAAIMKGLNQMGVKPGSSVLYLGASHGYTASFISDIVGDNGVVFALDFAPRVVRDLVFICEKRKNMAPIMADANLPEQYIARVPLVDSIIMDIAQRDQVGIFLKNVDLFLKKGGFGVLAIKARSTDVTKKPRDIFRDAKKELEKHLAVVDYRSLEPYEHDHCLFVCKKL